jgi:hypothetical protein
MSVGHEGAHGRVVTWLKKSTGTQILTIIPLRLHVIVPLDKWLHCIRKDPDFPLRVT